MRDPRGQVLDWDREAGHWQGCRRILDCGDCAAWAKLLEFRGLGNEDLPTRLEKSRAKRGSRRVVIMRGQGSSPGLRSWTDSGHCPGLPSGQSAVGRGRQRWRYVGSARLASNYCECWLFSLSVDDVYGS